MWTYLEVDMTDKIFFLNLSENAVEIRVIPSKSLFQLTLSVQWFYTDFLLCHGVQTSYTLLSITSFWIHWKLYRCNLTQW